MKSIADGPASRVLPAVAPAAAWSGMTSIAHAAVRTTLALIAAGAEEPIVQVVVTGHRLRATWSTVHDLELSLNWRHIGRLRSEFTSSNPNLNNPANVFPIDSHIGAYEYFDADASSGSRRDSDTPLNTDEDP